jgi:hypothetical protein
MLSCFGRNRENIQSNRQTRAPDNAEIDAIERQLVTFLQYSSPEDKLEELRANLEKELAKTDDDKFRKYFYKFLDHITTDECCRSTLFKSKDKRVFLQVNQPNGSIAVCSRNEPVPEFENKEYNKLILQALTKHQQGGSKRRSKKITRRIYIDRKTCLKYIVYKKERIFITTLRGKYRYVDANRDSIILGIF